MARGGATIAFQQLRRLLRLGKWHAMIATELASEIAVAHQLKVIAKRYFERIHNRSSIRGCTEFIVYSTDDPTISLAGTDHEEYFRRL